MIRVKRFRRKRSGFWYVRYWIGNRKVEESARTQDERRAEEFRADKQAELNAGIQPVKHGDIGELVNRYLEALPPGTSASHQHEARRILLGFVEVCGRRGRGGCYRLPTGQLSPEMIDRYINRRKQTRLHKGERKDSSGRRIIRYGPVSNVTLRKELRYLSGFFNWCCRQRPPFLRENPIPLSNASMVKDDAKPHFMITEEEFRALLKACDTPREYLFLLLAWWTGGRRGELLALHYYHFDFEACTLDIRHFNNNTLSVLPISEEIVGIVERLYRDAGESEPLFGKDPLPYHAFERLCRDAGVRHHRFHDFRISTSMVIKSGGFDASLAAAWVGNSEAVNARHYTDLRPVAKKVGSLLQVADLPPVPW